MCVLFWKKITRFEDSVTVYHRYHNRREWWWERGLDCENRGGGGGISLETLLWKIEQIPPGNSWSLLEFYFPKMVAVLYRLNLNENIWIWWSYKILIKWTESNTSKLLSSASQLPMEFDKETSDFTLYLHHLVIYTCICDYHEPPQSCQSKQQ